MKWTFLMVASVLLVACQPKGTENKEINDIQTTPIVNNPQAILDSDNYLKVISESLLMEYELSLILSEKSSHFTDSYVQDTDTKTYIFSCEKGGEIVKTVYGYNIDNKKIESKSNNCLIDSGEFKFHDVYYEQTDTGFGSYEFYNASNVKQSVEFENKIDAKHSYVVDEVLGQYTMIDYKNSSLIEYLNDSGDIATVEDKKYYLNANLGSEGQIINSKFYTINGVVEHEEQIGNIKYLNGELNVIHNLTLGEEISMPLSIVEEKFSVFNVVITGKTSQFNASIALSNNPEEIYEAFVNEKSINLRRILPAGDYILTIVPTVLTEGYDNKLYTLIE